MSVTLSFISSIHDESMYVIRFNTKDERSTSPSDIKAKD